MSFLIDVSCADVADRVGWTLMHSLWQCAVVAIVLAITLQAMGRRTASARYMVACAGMATMFVGFVATFFVLLHAQREWSQHHCSGRGRSIRKRADISFVQAFGVPPHRTARRSGGRAGRRRDWTRGPW